MPDCRKVERTLHFVFGERRTRTNREFFTIDPDLAKAVIEFVAVQQEALSDIEQGIAPAQREEIEEVERTRAARLNFERLGGAVGTLLRFSKDPDITCTVAAPKSVLFRGHEQSPSAAAHTAIREMGYTWQRISGSEHWLLDGVKLADVGAITEPAPV